MAGLQYYFFPTDFLYPRSNPSASDGSIPPDRQLPIKPEPKCDHNHRSVVLKMANRKEIAGGPSSSICPSIAGRTAPGRFNKGNKLFWIAEDDENGLNEGGITENL